ncbi:receptor-type tyrosine-protein phosphatase mu-like [Diadema antillarum]|uniref:receptor-type tyrosine-protein phosphatase mu-like n=1 Tax=Diadema antillarum TaxID=105358 RepID=UPI003A88A5C6
MIIMSAMWGCRCDFGLCRLLEYLAVFITLCPMYLQGERVNITVLSAGFSNIEATNDTQLQCYRSSPSSAASRVFGRTAPIPSDTSPDPPEAESYGSGIRRVQFPNISEWDEQGFGVFYCRGSQEGYDDQTISSFFKRSDAYFEPVDGKFTRTVNVGDTGVMIKMRETSNSSLENPVWRKDGGDPVTGQTTNTFMFPDPIVAEDEGIYEIYYSGMRSQGRGALYRLIVRDCPAGKWGPPNCVRICDKCYNGGVCDDHTGRCVCPNNFKGPNCLEICRTGGGNRFGPNCEFRCTYVGDPPAECSPHQFCLPDPFGCSCDTGRQGINCNTDCANGTYGAGCSQTCHCQSGLCNRYSGVCRPTETSDCETGWSGDNCQIPDICDDGYYGTNCTYKCHCLNDAPCDKITGVCQNRQCAPFFNIYDGVNCRVLPVMEVVPKVNASTSTSLTIEWIAWNEQSDIGDPPVTEYSTYYRIPDGDWIDGPKVAAPRTSAVLRGLDPDTKYEVSVAAVREGPGGTGPKSDSLTTVTNCANLSAPILVSATANVPRQITVIWQARPSGTKKCSTGFTKYTFHYTTEDTHFSGSETLNNFEVIQTDLRPYLRYTLTDLEPYLQYTITVTAVRNDSESAASSEVTVRTLEEAPPVPVNVAVSNSTQDSLIVTWSAATPIHLNGEIRAYKLQYRRTAPEMDDYYILANVTEVQYDMRFQILDLSAGSMYSIQVRTVNCAGESDWSPLTTGETKSEPDANGALAGGIVGGVFIFFIIVGLVVGFISRRRNQDQKQLNIIDVSAPEQGRDTVVCENAYAVAPENNLYEGLKNVPVIELAASSCNPERKSESMNPRCYRKYELILQDDSRNIEMTTFKGCGSPSCSKKWSGSHDNLDEPEMEESNRNNMYQNLAAPGPIPVHELQAYIEHKKAEKGNGLIQEYQMLKSNQLHPWNVASKEQNKAKNRFENIIAYDHSRVVLETVDGDPHSDYYNANYIRNFRGEKVIIASQAPNEASLTDFWRMIWQENVETVVMVTALTQNGKDECTQYWPEETRSINIGNFSIFLFEEHTFSDHVIRELDVKMGRSEEKRTVTQFHYMSWSKKEVPEDYTTLLDFVDVVLRHHTTMPLFKRNRPMLVHCSAGAGRTGTFLTLYNMLFMMREIEKVDIFGFVNQMRENRIKMVDTQDQYLFIYNALLEVYFLGQTHTPVAQFKKKLSTLNRVDPKTKKINIQLEYELLDSLAPVPPRNAFRGGKMPQNKNKNRFPDILPLERKRPCLISEGLEDSTDYINASLMNTFTEEGAFVVTQAPLPNTEVDIWRLVFDWKCPVIVMLNELDPSDWTCPQYWPSAGTFQMGSLNITRVGSSSEPHFVCNTFTVSSKGESVTVTQFRLLGWSAASTYLRSRMSLIHLVRAAQKAVKTAHTSGPVIVHCINGTGWSGVFCALWSVIDKFERKNTVDIFHAVKNLRANRPNMVESLDQYKLCYDVMSKYLYGESAGECVRGYAYFLLRELEGE